MIDAVVTGFAKSRALAEASLAPLMQMRRENLLRSIVCTTWDSPEIDAYADWIGAMDGVALARVAQPQATGTGNQRGVVYQVETLRAALALLPKDSAFTLKSRPDFVFDVDFLRRKLATVRDWSTAPARSVFGIAMPKPVLQRRIWIPWADTNQPFYYEDAVFLGATSDVAKLVTKLAPEDIATLGDENCGSFAHAVRYAKLFVKDYPLFQGYLKHYRYFASDFEYRRKLVSHVVNDGFFWHMLVAHAWILHSHFHVDAGAGGDLRFYSNTVNPGADWSKLETLRLANPYDHLEQWRAGTQPGKAYPSVQRFYGRIVDDAWQQAMFTQPLTDFPRTTLTQIVGNVAGCRDGRFREIESEFYAGLGNLHAVHGPKPAMAKAG
ncbi:MAG: hypothetical protein JOZ72_06190 [Alphaproteobacteria bacterium]|nr:hypothetical protein [Alphaproteobacteria bacterium]